MDISLTKIRYCGPKNAFSVRASGRCSLDTQKNIILKIVCWLSKKMGITILKWKQIV